MCSCLRHYLMTLWIIMCVGGNVEFGHHEPTLCVCVCVCVMFAAVNSFIIVICVVTISGRSRDHSAPRCHAHQARISCKWNRLSGIFDSSITWLWQWYVLFKIFLILIKPMRVTRIATFLFLFLLFLFFYSLNANMYAVLFSTFCNLYWKYLLVCPER